MKFYLGVRSSCPRAAEFACSLPVDVLEFCVRVWERLTALLAPSIGSFQPNLQRTQQAFMYGFAAVLCVSALQKKKKNERLCL